MPEARTNGNLHGNLSESATIRLPWPVPQCWPNRTKNRFARQKARKDARRIAGICAFRQRTVLPDGKLLAILRFHPPRNAGFDLDNAHAAMKGAIDGLFDVCGRDDGDIDAALPVRCRRVKGGLVVIEFRPMAVVAEWLRSRPSTLLD